jgi:ParB family transcriptional regulator, chromosome partitioning protein
MPLQLDDLAALDTPALDASGVPLMLAIDSIDEDPEQPRQEFDAGALQELADTIRERGVRQPISVRPNLQRPGRWILNFGARRLRASKLAGLTQIPAFIDTSADSYDQVIENEQREGLRPLELAMFVQKRLALGDSQAEIARRLGKSRQWVTLATAMIDPPDWLMDLYRQGRCRGMLELYELRRLHGDHPRQIEAWVSDRDSITRDGVSTLRAELSGSGSGASRLGTSEENRVKGSAAVGASPLARADAAPAQESAKPPSKGILRLHVEMEGEDYELVVSVAPSKEGHLYVRPLSGGARRLVAASALKLRGFVSR